MTMITPSYLGETIEYSSLHACRSTLEDPTEADILLTGDGIQRSSRDQNLTKVLDRWRCTYNTVDINQTIRDSHNYC